MKTLFSKILLFGSITLWVSGCAGTQAKGETSRKVDRSVSHATAELDTIKLDTSFGEMTDSRDGETYAIVSIGKQTWMAENLRYNSPGSWLNPHNPSAVYGRLYDAISAQTACPVGWHLPSDLEWNELEMALGMSANDMDKTGWRGEHGIMMKSNTGWNNNGNGTNHSGFNAYPAGYLFDGDSLGGLGNSMGYWSALVEDFNGAATDTAAKAAWMRFLGGPLKGVNRMYDDTLDPEDMIACRCLKD